MKRVGIQDFLCPVTQPMLSVTPLTPPWGYVSSLPSPLLLPPKYWSPSSFYESAPAVSWYMVNLGARGMFQRNVLVTKIHSIWDADPPLPSHCIRMKPKFPTIALGSDTFFLLPSLSLHLLPLAHHSLCSRHTFFLEHAKFVSGPLSTYTALLGMLFSKDFSWIFFFLFPLR